jgi:nucleotide-binding universal stress UspA family protein
MIRKILVAFDDGSQALKALDAAIEIAKNKDIEIHIVSAYTVPIMYQGDITSGSVYPDNTAILDYLYENTRAFLETMLIKAAAKVRQENIPVYTEIVEGSPGRAITEIAENSEIDLVCIGSHNRTAVNRFFMGSVSNYVLQHARCLVLVAKDE